MQIAESLDLRQARLASTVGTSREPVLSAVLAVPDGATTAVVAHCTGCHDEQASEDEETT